MTEAWEKCGRCQRPAPPAVEGPEGMAAQGWITYEGSSELVIDVPVESAILPPEVAEAIRAHHDHLVRIEPDPQIEVAAVREAVSVWLGNACPDCQKETGWDDTQWAWFLSGAGEEER